MKTQFLFLFLVLSVSMSIASDRIDLSGEWKFRTDPMDEGIGQGWQLLSFDDEILLPGSMASNGKGNDVTLETKWTATNWSDSSWFNRPDFAKFRKPENLKLSFWLTPVKEYVGAAWYQKTIKIPAGWKNRDVFLHLERCHWETKVWVNGVASGMQNSLSTPHVYLLPGFKPGKENTITIRVDNRIRDINPGLDAHSVSDNTQTNWNGVIGDIFLEARPRLSISHLKVTPDVQNRRAKVDVEFLNHTGSDVRRKVRIATHLWHSGEQIQEIVIPVLVPQGKFVYTTDIEMGEKMELWSEHNPALYKLTAELDKVGNSKVETIVGMRSFTVEGTRFLLNGKPLFLRGTLECAIFPLTGYPPTDVASWKRIMTKVKEFGLNHIRFHSWCPPKAAFVAADEIGVYLQVEVAAWATIGNGEPIDQFIYDESERIVREYGNHPSFCLMAYGNEPSGNNQRQFLGKFVTHWKSKDNRRVYTSGAGWPEIPENEYHNIPAPRIQHWGAGLKSSINAQQPQTTSDYARIINDKKIPVVSHEIGQWCVFPNFDEIAKYTGVLKAKNFEQFQEHLSDKNMGHLAKQFHMASGKLQALCYKADIEASLRTKDMAGFQLLDLHDFPGQGTALVGVLDAFWDEKEYISAQEYRRFCNTVVPLARLSKMVYTTADTLYADVEIANFGGKTLSNTGVSWAVYTKNQQKIAAGKLPVRDYPEGNGWLAGKIALPLAAFVSPESYELKVMVDGTEFVNTWDIWVYPEQLNIVENEVYVTDTLDQTTLDRIKNGGNVLLSVKRSQLKPEKGGAVEHGFSTVFWNTSWTKNQAPHTLGILCDPAHPVFKYFPTEYHTNWQWWDIIHGSAAINTDHFPVGLNALVQPIHTWFDNQRLALVFEARIGAAKVIVTGIDFKNNISERPATRQLKYSMLSYMNSDRFKPGVSIQLSELNQLFR